MPSERRDAIASMWQEQAATQNEIHRKQTNK